VLFVAYSVQTPVFEGPFDLLLHLILKQEVDLWEVNLAAIIDEYLTKVGELDAVDLDSATEFLLIAATLVELKARRLLPGQEDVELDEELAKWEERDYLLARLLECKTFQDAARVLHQQMLVAARRVSRLAGPEEPFRSLAPDPLERLDVVAMAKAAAKGLAPRPEPPTVRTDHVAPIRISVRDQIEHVLALLPARDPISFRDLCANSTNKLESIVRFLACLELFKQGFVDIDQVENFANLTVRALAPGEGVDLDLASLAEWGDEDAVVALAEAERDEAERDEAERERAMGEHAESAPAT
jgi:segregation and condensation protein A